MLQPLRLLVVDDEPDLETLIRQKFRKKIKTEVDGWKTARLLTDDQAPVEMAWDLMAFKYAK